MVDFARMLGLDDPRWTTMTAGYRMPFDPRDLLKRLESDEDASGTWHELWNELHHQGDVGEGSFAAVPHLVNIYKQRGIADWNTYAIVAVIELARNEGENPDVPDWLRDEYFEAIRDLAQRGASEILQTDTPEVARSILSILAIEKGLRIQARFLINCDDDQLQEIESQL